MKNVETFDENYDNDSNEMQSINLDYVICSTSYMANETYVFPSNEEGSVANWSELGGISERWGCDEWTSHKLAMSITFGDNHNYEFVRTLENTKCDQSLWKIKNI